MVAILGWIQYEKVRWEVPGLVYKLAPLDNKMRKDSSLNSSKSNRLPQWNQFFQRFARNQYTMYELVHKKAGIRKLYEACYRDNLHSIWASQELYREGNFREMFYGILEKNMRPVYDSARRQGYEVWTLQCTFALTIWVEV